MKIYRNNQEIADASSISYSDKFMSKCELSCEVNSPVPVDFAIGDYCLFEIGGTVRKLYLDDAPEWQKIARRESYGEAFKYTLKLVSPAFELERCIMKDIILNDESGTEKYFTDQTTWSTYGTAKELANRIQANINRLYAGEQTWEIEILEEGEPRLLSFDNTNAWNAVAMFDSEFGLKFTVVNRHITVGTAGELVNMPFRYGEGNGLYSITQSPDLATAVVTRLFAFGGTNNIPADYNKKGLVQESQYLPRLMLPGYSQTLKNYIESSNIAVYGVREGTQIFDEIFPSIKESTAEELIAAGIQVDATGRLDEIVHVDPIDDPNQGSFTVYIKDCGFDLNDHILPGSTPMLSVSDGMLGGYEFEISSWKKTGKINQVVLVRNQDNNYPLPNESTTVAPGDHFVLLGISMPPVYVNMAEERLLAKAKEYLSQNDKNHVSYNVEIDSSFLARRPEIAEQLLAGNLIHLEDEDKGLDEDIIIESLAVNIDDTSGLRTYSVTLSNEVNSTTLDRIKNDVAKQAVTIQRNKTTTDKEARRNSQSLESLRDYIFDPDGNINDTFLRIMMLQVGADSMNYRLEKTAFFNNVGTNISVVKDRVELGSDILHHYAYQHSDNNSGTWVIGTPLIGSLPEFDKPYFVSIKANRSSDQAEWIISGESLSVESEDGFYIFNFGIIYPVDDAGIRDFKETRGITSAYGDTLIAGKITSLDGNSWWDLTTGEFLLGAPGDVALSFLGGELRLTSYDEAIKALNQITDSTKHTVENIDSYINTTLADKLDSLGKQIDKTVESWFYPYTPTNDNYPANEWVTEESKRAHVGDTFTNTQEYVDDATSPDAGKSWRWVFESNAFKWTPIADSDAVKALKEAALAKDVADGKRRVFTEQPTNAQKYDVGDLWVNATFESKYINDILRCIHAKVEGAPFAISHWVLASKYTDDTLAEEAVNKLTTWASDKFISPVEKTGLKQQKADIQSEHAEIISQATKFGLYAFPYESAYEASLASLTKYTATSPENIPVENDYFDIAAYYDARREMVDAISSATKKAFDDLEYLKGTLKKGSTTVADGVVLSNFIGVTDETGEHVQAGINGSDEIGYSADHGKLMIFAGASDISTVETSPIRIYEDGRAYFNEIIIKGSVRSPFVPYSGAIVVGADFPDLSDNLAMGDIQASTGILDAYFQWDAEQNGRTITIVNYLYETHPSHSWIAMQAPTGHFFFENGIKKKMLYIEYETIVLKGYGEGDVFYGWIVLSRTTMPSGHASITQKIVYQGFVSESGEMVHFQSARLGKLTSKKTGTGEYSVIFPYGQLIPPSDYIVMLTPVKGFTAYNTVRTAYLSMAYSNGFNVGIANGATLKDGGFAFQVIDTRNWSMYENLTAANFYLRLDGLDADYSAEINSETQTVSIPVESNGNIKISLKDSWTSLVSIVGGKINIRVIKNASGATRSTQVILKLKEDLTITRHISVKQTPAFFLKLDGIDGDQTFVNQPAEGVTLRLALATDGTPQLLSHDARLAVGLPLGSGTLMITVPRNTGNTLLQYDPVVVVLKEDSSVRVGVAITQKASGQQMGEYLVALSNATGAAVTFQDSKGVLYLIHPGFIRTVTIGRVACIISLENAPRSVIISATDLPYDVWEGTDITANKPYTIDTTTWLNACASGADYFTVG